MRSSAPRARAADHDKAGVAHAVDLLAVHDARARAHEVIRFLARARRLGEHVHVLEHAAGLTDNRIVGCVGAIENGIDPVAFVHDRHGMRNIDRVIAVTPGIERIAVAGDAADDALGVGALLGRQRWQIEAGRGGIVEDQFRQSARAGDDRNAATAWPALALAHGQNFRHLVEIVDFDGAVRAQQLREDARRTGQATSMAGDGALGALGAADLDDDDGLAGIGGAVERGDIALRIAHGFGKRRDHFGIRVVDQIIEVVNGARHRLIAGGHRQADAEAAQVGQQRDADRSALRHDADIADDRRGIANVLLIGGDPRRRVEDAHAVRPAHRHAGLARHGGNLVLEFCAVAAQLGKAGVIDDRGARAALDRKPHLLRDQRIADAEHDDVRRLGQFGEARIAFDVQYGRIFRVHRIDRPGEADGAQRLNDRAPGTAAIGGSDDGDRARLDKGIELHGYGLPGS